MLYNRKFIAAAFGLLCAVAVTGSDHEANAVGRVELQIGKFAVEKGVFNTIFAKEICSCQFVDGLTLEECQERDNLPSLSHKLVNLDIDPVKHTVTSTAKGAEEIKKIADQLGFKDFVVGGPASAHLDEANPQFGCVLTELPSDHPVQSPGAPAAGDTDAGK